MQFKDTAQGLGEVPVGQAVMPVWHAHIPFPSVCVGNGYLHLSQSWARRKEPY